MKIDFDFELPDCAGPDFETPRLNTEHYERFIEFNQTVIRENGLIEQVLAARSQPVDAVFSLD
ncbi:hypothetical protein WJU23_01485 [Prosthecobacter sp. SYSU 5D2]|uniref:hypothetical protein n=1 Tax=Prosthecobacter sp. SYSU 5D2 TaxID=3134134 RepID=UPI0031FE5ACE